MKKLMVLVIAALPAAAMADVEIYGKMTGEIARNKTATATYPNNSVGQAAGPFGATTQIDSASGVNSHIGFRGNEALGNGLKAIWQLEQGIDFTNGGEGNTFATRDSFIGLASDDWGSVKLGHISTFQNSNMEYVDPWTYNANTHVNGSSIFTRTDGRVDSAIRYDSPTLLGGLNFALLYGFNEPGGGQPKQNTFNFGVSYNLGAFTAAYSYLNYQNSNAWTNPDGDIVRNGDSPALGQRFEVMYSEGPLYLAAGYQQTKGYGNNLWPGANPSFDNLTVVGQTPDSLLGKNFKTKEAELTASYSLGNFTPRLTYAYGWDVDANGAKQSDTGYKQWVVGTDYQISKRTMSYLSYGRVKYGQNVPFDSGSGDDNEYTLGVGISHSF
ncbi:porin [Craterilacuibacter sp. RT1T]|uniref:porin n=1 Tax=Craterilacuibacter sp. RT1T TaxID=2942211 RepID=UPI0020C11EB3|nr:porin [Craterilacuibacter sp. RT1T]MCL6264333.1 porin [Craterilacuibacter sp. RT1T]